MARQGISDDSSVSQRSVRSTQSMPIIKIKNTPIKALTKLVKKKRKKKRNSGDEGSVSSNSYISTDNESASPKIDISEAQNISLLSSVNNDESVHEEDFFGLVEPSGPPEINRVSSPLSTSSRLDSNSTNARLEAAYLEAKRENIEFLRKEKEREENARGKQREKLKTMMDGANSGLKWAKTQIGSRKKSTDTVVEPIEETGINLSQPVLESSKKGKKQLIFKRHDSFKNLQDIEREAQQEQRIKAIFMKLLVILSSTVLLYVAASRDPRVSEALEKLLDQQGIQKLVDSSSAILVVVLTKVKAFLGLGLDWEGDILPLAKNFMDTTSDMPLKGVNVVVSRATSSVGVGVTMALSQLGAQVVAIDESSKKLSALRAKVESLVTITADMGDLTAVSQVADAAIDTLGYNVDILVNNGGSYLNVVGETEQGYDKYFGANYLSQYLLTEKMLEPLKRSSRGSIIQVSSMKYMLVDGSGLEISEGRPNSSIPGKTRSIPAYLNSLLASIMHANYLSRTTEVHVANVFPRALTTPSKVSSVLHTIMDTKIEGKGGDSALQKAVSLMKEKVAPPSIGSSPANSEELQDHLYDWSQKAIAPYLWLSFFPHSKETVKEAVNVVVHPVKSEGSLLYKGSIATLLSFGSMKVFRRVSAPAGATHP